ncbi:RNA-directed DNA polymerase, eukaryota, reverse transcriptase zinc-binding domain protein, partial [Tanacetum coccineum]
WNGDVLGVDVRQKRDEEPGVFGLKNESEVSNVGRLEGQFGIAEISDKSRQDGIHFWLLSSILEYSLKVDYCVLLMLRISSHMVNIPQRLQVVFIALQFQINPDAEHDIVNEVQSAFIAERQILDGPFILNEILQWSKTKKKQSLIFKVDFEKAYDSVRWDFLDDILKKFGFGEKWCKWIQSCLRSSRGSILINGSPTKEFQIITKASNKELVISILVHPNHGKFTFIFQRVVDNGFWSKGLICESKIVGVNVDSDKLKNGTGTGELGRFFVASVRKIIDDKSLSDVDSKTRWIKCAEKMKCFIVGWNGDVLGVAVRQRRDEEPGVCMSGEQPKQWLKWMSLAEWWYNTNHHSAINTTPDEMVYGQTPPLHVPYVGGESKVEAVDRTLLAREEAIKNGLLVVSGSGLAVTSNWAVCCTLNPPVLPLILPEWVKVPGGTRTRDLP